MAYPPHPHISESIVAALGRSVVGCANVIYYTYLITAAFHRRCSFHFAAPLLFDRVY